MPKVKRGAPRTGSRPIMASSRPSTVISSAASRFLPASPITRQRPATISAEELGRPEFQARAVASGMATTTRAMVASGAADERADRGDGERRAGAALARHGIAVDAGDDRRGLARHVDQHRGDGAAIHRAVVDGAEHDDGAGRVEAEGERDQDRGAGGRSEAGQHADQGAEHAAGEGEHQVAGAQRRAEARQQVAGRRPSLRAPTGRPAGARPASG